jgi:autotransporter-associated beta strand protein
MYSRAAAGSVIPIGELSGVQGSTLNSGAGSGAGQAYAVTYQVGGLNTTATFAGNLIGNVGIIKEGTGTWILTGTNNITTGAMTINSGTIQIGDGGTIGTLGRTAVVVNNATLAFNRSNDLTVTNVIEGSGALIQMGSGNLILSPATGANTYLGKTVVNAGALAIANQSVLGGDPGSFVADLLTLNGGALRATTDLTLDASNRGITLGTAGGAFSPDADTTLTIASRIAGAGSLSVNGSGTLTLSGANTYSGKTILNSGTLAIADESLLGNNPASSVADQLTLNGGTLGSTTTLAINDSNRGISLGASGGTFSPDASSTLTLANRVTGTGPLIVNGAGTLTLSGANNYTGPTTINQGTLALGATGSIANSPAITVASGTTFDVSAVSGFALAAGQTLAGDGVVVGGVTAASGAMISPGSSVGTLTFSGNLTQNGGVTNLIDVSSANNDLIVVQGNLILSGVNTIGLNMLSTLPAGRYLLIRYNGTLTGGAANLLLAGYPPSRLTAALDVSVPKEIALVISGTAATLVWNGDSTLNTWDVNTTKNWLSGATPEVFSNGDNVTFSDSGSAAPAVNLVNALTPGVVTVDATKAYTFGGSGKITGPASLTKTNSGTLILLTKNDYFGPTIIQGGTLQVGNGSTSGSLGTGAVTDNSALVFNTPDSVTNIGVITGTGSLTQAGSGKLILSANNSYSGSTIISAGTLQVGNGTNSGSLGIGSVANDGLLAFKRTGNVTNIGAITGTGSLAVQGPATVTLTANNSYSGMTTVDTGTLQIGGGSSSGTLGTYPEVMLTNNGALAFNRSDNITNAIVVTGAGNLVKQGPGMLTLVTSNSYTGNTIINGGTLQVGNGEVLPAGIASLGSGPVIDDGILVFNFAEAVTFDTYIRGSGQVAHVGSGTLTLNTAAANDYSGGTVISNTTLTLGSVIANPNALGTGPIMFYGGTLSFFGYDNSNTTPEYNGNTNSLVIPEGQTATIFLPPRFTGPGLAGRVTGSGTLNLMVRYVRGNVGGDWSGFTGLLNVSPSTVLNDGGEFRINSSGFPNAAVYLGSAVTMYNINGGNQTIDIGELSGDPGSIVGPGNGSSGSPTWRVGGKNTTNTFAGIIRNAPTNGITSVTKVGTGTWILTSAQEYTGATTISNGVLALKEGGSIFTSASIILGANGTLDVSELPDGMLVFNQDQALRGDGIVWGSVMASAGTILAPGAEAGLVGRLTITNTLTLPDGCTTEIDYDATLRTNDVIVGLAKVNYGGTLSVNGSFVGGESLKLFDAKAYSGAFTSIVPDIPGLDMTWDTSQLAVNGTLKVTGGAPKPTFGSIALTSPGTITISGSGGTPAGTYFVLSSTNVILPLIQWTAIATNSFDASGNFSFTSAVTTNLPVRFFAIQTSP